MSRQNLCVLGATGSIGLNTLDVAARHADRFCVYAISAHSDVKKLLDLSIQFKPRFAVISDSSYFAEAQDEFAQACPDTTLLGGAASLVEIAGHPDVDVVMAAIVGAAGLKSSLAAAEAGKRVLLANKESLVLAGQLFMDAVVKHEATLLPIDSEHNAIFQCLPAGYNCGDPLDRSISKILLTASGGPFREFSFEQLKGVTPEQACAHPNWSMGRKISVDSATLMNKGLELIEACWLFNVSPADIDVVIHPQSIIHSMVRYTDGSVLAQMGQPDMRTPIAYGLAWPERIEAGVDALDFTALTRLQFEEPDEERFPCLELARASFLRGGLSAAYLNAANEIAVESFLKGNIRFTDIPDIIHATLDLAPADEATTIEVVCEADREARLRAQEILNSYERVRA